MLFPVHLAIRLVACLNSKSSVKKAGRLQLAAMPCRYSTKTKAIITCLLPAAAGYRKTFFRSLTVAVAGFAGWPFLMISGLLGIGLSG